MRFTHILVVFVALVVATACSYNDIDEVHSKPEHASQYLQVVGRVAQYSDCNVATRSKKEGDESKVTSMGLALFPIENGTIGNCIYYDFELGGSIVFIVDRRDAVFNSYVDKQFAMYIFANMQGTEGFPTTSEAGVGKSLAYFTNCEVASTINVEEVPANGFPMMGSLGHTDGKVLKLKPSQTDANVDGLPLVDNVPTDNLEIPLKSMYAKFSFTIAAKPDQEIVGNKAPRFDLVKYSVNNIAETVDCDSDTNSDNDVIPTSGEVSMANYAQGATVATFDFYLPERYLTPSKSIDDVLPDELKSANNADEREKYQQRYKNKLVDGKAATYVTIKGKYTDHQGHVYDVDYNIYLGGNNYNDFNIIRNTHYDNSITIRGISASDEQADNEEAISIDWRVNVNRSTPLVIGLRRETLLDAHYEVRPLRLRLVGDNIPTGTSATVQILNRDGTTNNLPNWIRLEASGNSGDHITTDGLSKGKRKYFTTDLVTEKLKDGTSITVNNLSDANQTVWIYADENTDTKSRAAIVRVSYADVNTDYEIVQHGLHEITGESGRVYYIERYEEYLYNYDAEDSYGQTKEEGMPWGLDGVQLSNEHNSFTLNVNNTQWTDFYNSNKSALTYDFYIAKYDGDFVQDAGGTLHNFAGNHFTSDIYTKSQGNSSKVRNLTLADQASGAVEYCYNRNKRDEKGNVVNVEWYLPSADESEDFIVPAYNSYKEFQDNYYWTSQPAYIRNFFYYIDEEKKNKEGYVYVFDVYDDNTRYARATKVVYNPSDRKYYPALSGLNEQPDPFTDDTSSYGYNCDNRGCFYQMHHWRRHKPFLSSWKYTYTPNRTNDNFGGDEEYELDGKRYHVHLGHLYDEGMMQEGYHPRTRSNRVRCVRVVP